MRSSLARFSTSSGVHSESGVSSKPRASSSSSSGVELPYSTDTRLSRSAMTFTFCSSREEKVLSTSACTRSSSLPVSRWRFSSSTNVTMDAEK